MTWIILAALGYCGTFAAMREPLAWFIHDTRAKLPRRTDRYTVVTVILIASPALGVAWVWLTVRDLVRHQRVRRAIRRLPRQADPEQQHLVDELKNGRFYDAAHHPAGHIGADT